MTRRAQSAAVLCTAVFLFTIGCGESHNGGGSGDSGAGSDSSTTADGGGKADGAKLDAASEQPATPTYAVSGTVTGLAGTGLTLSDGAGHQLAVTADGAFTFATRLAAGTAVSVSVMQQPTGPAQTCTVTGGTAAAIAANLSTVAVACTTRGFTIGGMVTGLLGTGLTLQNNAGDDLAVTANGTFAFATAVTSGQTFTVTIKTQPSGPTQTCQVAGGSGTVGGANVTSVAVNCSSNRYTIGGTVTGLSGTGLVLQNNGGDDLPVSASGTFAFATTVASGGAFAVTVKTNPTSPSATCSVGAGSGTVAGSHVTTVVVTCSTNSYTVGGSVSGLSGAGLVLQNNLGGNLSVTASGSFQFAAPVASGGAYAVTVLNQPTNPTQTCAVTNGTGMVGGAAVTGVAVTCTTSAYTVGGSVVGLAGTGLVLRNSGGNDLAIASDGTFVFTSTVASGTAFAVTVGTQPTAPSQTCNVSGGTGTIGGGNVTSVIVNCGTDLHTVGGTVAGLVGGGLELALNGGTALPINGDGSFAFPTVLASGTSYAVTVVTQPTAPWQTCTIAGGGGSIVATDISNVAVTCTTNHYTVGGTVAGLAGAGLVLRNNGGDDLAVSASGTFTFATAVTSGQGYAVTVATSPTGPTQTCTVASGSGAVTGGAITNVAITCVTNTYAVGGTITGLAGTVVLENNGGDPLTLTANGSFVFGALVPSGGAYAVTVRTQPAGPTQTCAVASGSGTVVAGAITDVNITCVTNQYAIGGTVSGLLGGGLTLQNNAGDDLVVSAGGSGAFTFPATIASGSTFAVTIKTQPSGPTQTCTVTGGSGTVGAANVTSVAVNCATNAFTVGGTVTGLLGGGLVLQNNAGDDLAVSGSGSFAFATAVSSGGAYAVTVKTQPTTPWQTCVVTSGSGTVTSASVTSVQVACTTNTYNVAVSVTGLAGSGLVVQNNGAGNITVTGNSTFTFATPVASGGAYNVTVLTQPSSVTQTCTVTSPTGTIAGAGVTLAVACVTNTYTVGGTVAGLLGSGLVLSNNGGDDRSVAAPGAFTFATAVASGGAYAVTVKTQPTNPSQTCTVASGSGTVAAANVTNVAVTCSTNTYNVKVAVTGLAGTGLVLRNNGGDNLSVTGSATFTFATAVASNGAYNVTVFTQPTSPTQTCTVTSPTGTVGGADVTLAVACVTNTYTVGGTITGLTGSGLVLRNNGGNDLTVASGATSFTFSTPVASSGAYAVTAFTQPSTPTQTCTVTSGSGTVTSANVTSVVVTCVTNTYFVRVALSGMAGGGLVFRNNGGDNLSPTGNGTFTFATKVASGAGYAVTVFSQPSTPTQTCTVTSPTGTIAAADVTLTAACVTNTYTVGGTITGLTGSGLVLRNNGGNDLTVASGATSFTFSTAVASSGAYAVTAFTQPSTPSQTCTVTSGSGTVTNANVTSVVVTCVTNTYNVKVAVTGLSGSGLVFRNNGGDNLSATSNATFTFATAVASGGAYAVTVFTQPSTPTQTCTVTSPTGTIAGADVTLNAACVTNTYTVGGTISGLTAAGLVLRNNGGNDLTVASGATSFTFSTAVASAGAYAVTVATQPTSPLTCAVTSGSGTVTNANVTNVAVTCSNATTICGQAGEGGTVTLTCTGGQRITAITFASYGTPNGSCGAFTTNAACHSATSTSVMNTACLNQTSCSVGANNGVFGDPCVGTVKRLWVNATCQ